MNTVLKLIARGTVRNSCSFKIYGGYVYPHGTSHRIVTCGKSFTRVYSVFVLFSGIGTGSMLRLKVLVWRYMPEEFT